MARHRPGRSKKRKAVESAQRQWAEVLVKDLVLEGPEERQEVKRKVLEALARGIPTLTEACEYAGVSKVQFYKWRKDDPAFEDGIGRVTEAVNERLEKTALEIALDERDGKMIRFLLRTRMPHHYSERIGIFGEIRHDIQTVEIVKEGPIYDADARVIDDERQIVAPF